MGPLDARILSSLGAEPVVAVMTQLRTSAKIVVRVCSMCGTRHTYSTWAKLRFLGYQDDGNGECIELRNCTCGSTIAIDLERRSGS